MVCYPVTILTTLEEYLMTEFIVYDALCGSGKTTKVKNYILDNPNERFIYISPFLKESYKLAGIEYEELDDDVVPKISNLTGLLEYDETNPVSKLRFKYPDRKKGRGSKETSLSHLMSSGFNITSTHQLFTHMSINSLEGAEQFTLIIDEALSVYEESNAVGKTEVKKLLEIGILYLDQDGITLRFDRDKFGINSDYKGDKVEGTAYEPLATMCDLSQLLLIDGKTIVWEMSADMLRKFKKVIICTYLFEGQLFSSYLKKHGIEYEINKFGKQPQEVKHLFDVVDDSHLNMIGADDYALSKSYFEKPSTRQGARDVCRKHLNTVMRKWGAKTDNRLFTCFKADKGFIGDKRYTKNWLPFNCRATNEFKDVEHIAYLVNVFPSPILIKAAHGKDTEFNDDIHALGELLQFLYRGCLRENKPMKIYLPSSRMRKLLFKWLEGGFE